MTIAQPRDFLNTLLGLAGLAARDLYRLTPPELLGETSPPVDPSDFDDDEPTQQIEIDSTTAAAFDRKQ